MFAYIIIDRDAMGYIFAKPGRVFDFRAIVLKYKCVCANLTQTVEGGGVV